MRGTEYSKRFLSERGKIILSILAISLGVFLISGIYAIGIADNEDPTAGFNIHVSVGRHDHANLEAQYDHYCKLTPPIVATCLLFVKNPSGQTILSEVEYIITREQYLQLPFRDRPNWHNHAVELTAERGEPRCISLPEGLECGALVSILKQTYGKVVNLWDVSDSLPSYPPYNFLVDSPYALEQDLNHNLHNEWKVGGKSTSSAGILLPIPGNGDGNGDGECKVSIDDPFEISYGSKESGDIIQINGLSNLGTEVIDYFTGNVEFKEGKISGRGKIRVHWKTTDGQEFNLYVSRFKARKLLNHDCERVSWSNSGSGGIRDNKGNSKLVEFNMDITYNLITEKIDAIAFAGDNVVFEFKDMIDIKFG